MVNVKLGVIIPYSSQNYFVIIFFYFSTKGFMDWEYYIWYQSPATTLDPQEWANMIIAGVHLEEELRWRFDHIEVRSSSINV